MEHTVLGATIPTKESMNAMRAEIKAEIGESMNAMRAEIKAEGDESLDAMVAEIRERTEETNRKIDNLRELILILIKAMAVARAKDRQGLRANL